MLFILINSTHHLRDTWCLRLMPHEVTNWPCVRFKLKDEIAELVHQNLKAEPPPPPWGGDYNSDEFVRVVSMAYQSTLDYTYHTPTSGILGQTNGVLVR